MAEVTSQDFQRLLEEQQRTNQLLVEGNKDPSLPSSIKQNLGEILNASRLAGQNEKFQKREGITEVDEAARDTVEGVLDNNSIAIKGQENDAVIADQTITQIVLLREGVSILGTQLNRMLKDMNINRVVNRLEEITPNKDDIITASQQAEIDKKRRAAALKELETNKNTEENTEKTVSILERLSKLDKKDRFGSLLTLLGLFGLFKVLTSPKILGIAQFLDEKVTPRLGELFTRLESIGSSFLDFLARQADTLLSPDATQQQKLLAGGALLATTILGIYSKSITKFALKKSLPVLLGFAKLGLAAFFSPIGLFAAAVLGAYFVKDEAIKRAKQIIEEEGAQDDAMAKMRIYTSTFLGEMTGGINNFLADVMAMFNEERAEEMRKVDYSIVINESLKGIGQFIADIFDNIRQFFVGSTDEDIKKDIEKQKEIVKKKQDRMDKILAGKDDVIPFAPGTLPFERRVRSLEKSLERLDELEGELKMLDDAGGGKLVRDLFGGGTRVVKNFSGGFNPAGTLALVGEGLGGKGGELVYMGGDAMVLNQQRTDAMLTAALQKGLSSGGGDGGDVITQIDGRVNNSSSILSVNNNRVTNPNSTLNAIAMST